MNEKIRVNLIVDIEADSALYKYLLKVHKSRRANVVRFLCIKGIENKGQDSTVRADNQKSVRNRPKTKMNSEPNNENINQLHLIGDSPELGNKMEGLSVLLGIM